MSIGIDLGTCFSCVAVYRADIGVEIIANDAGGRTTPSWIAFAGDEVLIGDAAKAHAVLDAGNTAFDTKRLIGRRFDDENVQQDIHRWPFKVVPDVAGHRALLEMHLNGRLHRVLPEELAAMLLRALKTNAEARLDKRIDEAVVTVPAYFSDAQRSATRNAGRLAGFRSVRLLNEPTAAAIAYRLDRFAAPEKRLGEAAINVVVFDVGGGTFDVSLLAINAGEIAVKATAGNTHLGGQDFDDRVLDFVLAAFIRAHNASSVSSSALRRLREQCERAKRTLSSSPEAAIMVDAFWHGIDLRTTLTRARFDALIADYIVEFGAAIDQVLRDAGVDRDVVDDVILVGGSTRIPRIRRLLSDVFGEQKLCSGVDVDEAVAIGAALHAAAQQRRRERDEHAILRDVMPLSVGVAGDNGEMVTMATRNTPIPTRCSARFATSFDGQTRVLVQVFEGERPRAADNSLLGTFVLDGIDAAPRGAAQIDVVFDVDEDGVLSVSATEQRSRRCSAIRIAGDRVRLSKDEVDAMLSDAEQFRSDDDALRTRLQARSALRKLAFDVRNAVDQQRQLQLQMQQPVLVASPMKKIDEREMEMLQAAVDGVFEWLHANHDAEAKAFNAKLDELQAVVQPVLGKVAAPGAALADAPAKGAGRSHDAAAAAATTRELQQRQ